MQLRARSVFDLSSAVLLLVSSVKLDLKMVSPNMYCVSFHVRAIQSQILSCPLQQRRPVMNGSNGELLSVFKYDFLNEHCSNTIRSLSNEWVLDPRLPALVVRST